MGQVQPRESDRLWRSGAFHVNDSVEMLDVRVRVAIRAARVVHGVGSGGMNNNPGATNRVFFC